MQNLALARPARAGSSVEVFVAACTGTGRLTGQVGRPCVLIDVAEDALDAIDDLNSRRVGCGVLWPGSFQPLYLEQGWDDWRLFGLASLDVAGLWISYGAAIVDGRIRLELPEATTVSELREQLAATMRHLRVHDVVRRPDWLEERSGLLADILVHPRYELTRYRPWAPAPKRSGPARHA